MDVLDNVKDWVMTKIRCFPPQHHIHPTEQGKATKLESHIHSLKTVIPRNPTSQGTLDHNPARVTFAMLFSNDARNLCGQGCLQEGLGGGACVQNNIDRILPFPSRNDDYK